MAPPLSDANSGPPAEPAAADAAALKPKYWSVFLTFAGNSLARDLSFRANMVIEVISVLGWILMNLGFYEIIFGYTPVLGQASGWGKYQFFVFFSTTTLIGGFVEAFFMTNADELSELIRTGNLDFALLKPIDTQFLVSLRRIDWSSLSSSVCGLVMLIYSLWRLHYGEGLVLSPLQFVLYPVYLICGIGIFYSLMISLASTSIWLGRNQSLQEFWFYITNFARYPMEIYTIGPPSVTRQVAGWAISGLFTFFIPVLVAVNVPARMLAMPLDQQHWWLVGFAIAATLGSLLGSRWIFQRALISYRSASS